MGPLPVNSRRCGRTSPCASHCNRRSPGRPSAITSGNFEQSLLLTRPGNPRGHAAESQGRGWEGVGTWPGVPLSLGWQVGAWAFTGSLFIGEFKTRERAFTAQAEEAHKSPSGRSQKPAAASRTGARGRWPGSRSGPGTGGAGARRRLASGCFLTRRRASTGLANAEEHTLGLCTGAQHRMTDRKWKGHRRTVTGGGRCDRPRGRCCPGDAAAGRWP